MLKILAERFHQKHRTFPFPAKEPVMPERFKGRPLLHAGAGEAARQTAVKACPTGAIRLDETGFSLDMGRCLFCGACENAAPDAVGFSSQFRLAGLSREELVLRPQQAEELERPHPPATPEYLRKLFKRSFRIREVSAGGCNACEADCNVLTTLVYDLGRFGIDFVASPRHADALLVTGPVPRNMHSALLTCYAAMPEPKVVIAVGACAISGGLFSDLDQESKGLQPHLPVDLFVPGCPPSPYTILEGLLRFLHREKG